MHSHFIEHVKTSRGDRLKADDEKLFNGEYWTGDKAELIHHLLKLVPTCVVTTTLNNSFHFVWRRIAPQVLMAQTL